MYKRNKKIFLFSEEAGLSLIELVVAVGIMGILVVGATIYHTAAYKSTTLNQDRTFCIQKAIQMVNELREKTAGTDITISLRPYDQINEDDNGNVTGESFSPILSVLAGTDPTNSQIVTNPLSSNTWLSTRWKFQRQIDIKRFSYTKKTTSEEPRLITVRCFYDASNDTGKTSPTDYTPSDYKGGIPLAEVTTVMRNLGQNIPTTQAYDLYAIAVDNTPGWWVTLSTVRPVLANAINNLQALNPGLEYRVHWITRNAFGRDKSYTPFLNTKNTITGGTYDDIESVYYYAGLLQTSNSTAFWLFNPNFLTQGKMNFGLLTNVGGLDVGNPMIGTTAAGTTDPSLSFSINPHPTFPASGLAASKAAAQNIANAGLLYDPKDPPNSATASEDDDYYLAMRYSLADYFNHGVRYPDELTEYCMRKYGSVPTRNAINNLWECIPGNTPNVFPLTLVDGSTLTTTQFIQRYTEPSLEPSLRMLMEQLYQNPDAFKNILILNVHGELLPVPPMRNYSDPAKNPTVVINAAEPRPWLNGFPNVRVVTHPEQVEYQNWSASTPTVNNNVRLRVYSYVTNPSTFTTRCDNSVAAFAAGPQTAILGRTCDPLVDGGNTLNEVPIVIRISGANNGLNFTNVNFIPGRDLFVRRIVGNTPFNETIDTSTSCASGANEDANLNDVLDSGEDANGNNQLDVPCEITGDAALNAYPFTAPNNANNTAGYFTGKAPTVESTNGEMWYQVQLWPDPNNGPDILLRLYNSPLRSEMYTSNGPGRFTGLLHEDRNNNGIVDNLEDTNGDGNYDPPGENLNGTIANGVLDTENINPNGQIDSRRLYGLEYIPSFTGTNTGTNYNYDLTFRDREDQNDNGVVNPGDDLPNPPITRTIYNSNNNTTAPTAPNAALNTYWYYKNTARWVITLANRNGLLNNRQLTIETRIGPRRATAAIVPSIPLVENVFTSNSPADNQYVNRALAQGYNPSAPQSYIPTAGLYGDGTVASPWNFVTANNVPSNVSRTYVWITDVSCTNAGTNPCIAPTVAGRAGPSGIQGYDFPYNPYRAPFTERFQFMGDPRHNPYIEVKLDNRYNWYFVSSATNALAQVSWSTGNAVAPFNTNGRINTVLNNVGFTGFTGNATNGWGGINNSIGRVPFDYPRLTEVYRMGVLKSRSIYNSISGWSFYYADPGSAMGADSSWMQAYPVTSQDWIRISDVGFVNRLAGAIPQGNSTYNATSVDLDEIAGWHGGRTRTVRQVQVSPPNQITANYSNLTLPLAAGYEALNAQSWFTMNWLGELYPDTLGGVNFYSNVNNGWAARGNLPTRNINAATFNPPVFKMDTEERVYLGWGGSRGTQDDSPPSFFNNAGTGNATTPRFNHISWGNPSTTNTFWTCQGFKMGQIFNSPIAPQIITARPFKTDQNTANPAEIIQAPYNTTEMRTATSIYSPFYYQNAASNPTNPCSPAATSFPNQMGSALLQVQLNPNGTVNDADDSYGYFLMNGLAPANDTNPNIANNSNLFMSTFNVMGLTYGFMLTGQPKHPVSGANLPTNPQGLTWNSIRQLPRVEVILPDPADTTALTNPQTLTVQWETGWRRWDNQPYTTDYSPSFAETTTPLYYVPMYSTAGGNGPWYYIIGDSNHANGDINNRVRTAPDDWRSRAPLPKADGGKYDPNDADPYNRVIHFKLGNISGPITTEQITWNVASWLPLSGTDPSGQIYYIRVVAHRKDINNHFAYHDLKIRVTP
jgi:type II secretory pathway pseudopilin PulG